MGPAAPAKVELLAPGARLGRYHLLQRLAIGGMAELHVACAEGVAGFQKVVALKRVLPNLAADGDFVEMFLNEARLAANLDHPNIVSVMDIGQVAGEYFYVMEYVHGVNVREMLADATKRGGLPLPVALAIVMSVATGLHYAHDRTDLDGRPLGLVHRDVSPANVLVSYDGAVKVTDFGIAKASARNTETIGGAMKGKVGYMSPEQCRGEAVDRRSDVFALGILLFELTTTERLFYADNDFAILNKVLRGQFEPPSARVPDYPPALEAIVLRALAPSPDDRYPTAEALTRDLEGFAHDAHLRCTTAVVADWLREVYGQPPYPRVEMLPARPDDPLEKIPTLVQLGGPADDADSDAITRYEPPGHANEPVRRRRVGAWLAALAVVAVGALGLIGWGMWRDAPRSDATTDHAGEGAVPPPTAPAAAAAPEAPPADDDDVTTTDEPTAPDAPRAAPPPPPPADPPVATPTERPTKRKKRRGKKRRGKGKPDGAGDIDALYPVNG